MELSMHSQGGAGPAEAKPEYDEPLIRFLEILWGEGYLSPGGPQEVDRVTDGIDFAGKAVLDIGCGSGGVTLHLARSNPTARFTGFDVEQPVIDHAARRARDEGLDGRAGFVRGDPGPLPFPDKAFDIVFSKDALIHVADKDSLFAEVFRVLKPGGLFVASDWLCGHDCEPSADMKAYLAAEGLNFGMASPGRYRSAMQGAGLVDIVMTSRNSWYRAHARDELDRMTGPLRERLAAAVGDSFVDKNIKTWQAMLRVLDSGEHCPTHLHARKPEG
jgi:SAM-dependent methyltransferase